MLKAEAHTLGNHALTEREFYDSGLFRGAIERIRGQFSATMREKREFVRHILNHLQDRGFIKNWESVELANRYDYLVYFDNGRIAGIETKGCLDGNNATIYERPPQAHEFILWSVCTNAAGDLRKNAWSGIHTRLGVEIIVKGKPVDGLVIWDMSCGSIGRPCPKLAADPNRATTVSHYRLPPPCVYVFPRTIPTPRDNPHPPAQSIGEVSILKALHDCFGGQHDEVNYVDFEVEHHGNDTRRRTIITRGGVVQVTSNMTVIKRSSLS
ncbi:MAG: hypothetical protein QOH70_2824 [Blastocatellia bacterium]|nr:hypothetical protein [Blastocatellia bacterium]